MSQTEVAPDRRSPPSTPRWVKVFGIIFVVLVLLFVALNLTGHSPMGNHMDISQMDRSPTPQGVPQP